MATESTNAGSGLSFDLPSEDTLLVRLTGEWKLANRLPAADEVMKQVDAGPKIKRITFDTEGLKGWDSGLLIFLIRLQELASQGRAIAVEQDGLVPGVKRLLRLAAAVPERAGARREAARISFLDRLGDSAIAFGNSILEMLAFIGEASVALLRLIGGKARFRSSDLLVTIQECGAQALPIVSLISLLVGLILAFIGAIQLKIFGAQIYVASLVGIGMVRALAAVMTGIIMAGRTGAAFAAQLGTMQVNEEIDALKTLGVSPMEFLVLPRMLALFLMMPLLSLYANLMGILGGLLIGVLMLNLNFMEYFNKTKESVSMNDLWVGLFSAAVFGVLVALAGCMRGMQCGRSASAVGEATTSAVVTSIVSIVVAMAVITVVCNILNI
ncbi:MAG TPA: ABC transporter permease [Thermodesulfovibrionales bacterium]|nr:ABC transporter permease [Thermodesulfovibrionales bacterium]